MNEIKIVSQLDRGLAYAEACFETFRVLNGHVFQQIEHQLRLQKGLKTYGLICTGDELKNWFEQAVTAANMHGDDMLLRMTVSGGDAAWGLLAKNPQPHVQIQMMPSANRNPLHLQSVIWPFPLREKKVKYTADYAESLRAIQQWGLDNPMQQALIGSDSGNILSTLTANIAIYRQGQWCTPQGLGILSGVVRHFLLEQGVVQPVASLNGRDLDVNHPAMSKLFSAFKGMSGVPSMGVMNRE